MKGYCYNKITGEFVGEMDLQLDPLESKKKGIDIYLIAANTTTQKPPVTNEKQFAKYIDNEWVIEDKPEPEKQKEPEQQTQEELDAIALEQKIQAELRLIAIERIEAKKDKK